MKKQSIGVLFVTVLLTVALISGCTNGSDGGGGTVIPNITSLTPTTTFGGYTLNIIGTDFGSTRGTSTVTINGVAVTNYIFWSDTAIGVEVPAFANTGPVVVTVGTNASNTVTFTRDRKWQEYKLIDNGNDLDADNPKAAVDSSGNAIAVFPQDDGVSSRVYAAHFDASTGTWGAPVAIDDGSGNPAGSPEIAVAPNGDAICVFIQNDGVNNRIRANTYDASAGTWGSAILIDAGAGNPALSPVIAVDADGNGVAAFEQSDGANNRIYANIYDASAGTWSGATLIDAGPGNTAFTVKVAVDSTGNGHAAFVQSDGANDRIYANRYDFASSAWGVAVLIDAGPGNDALLPSITVDHNDNVHVAFSQNDGTNDRLFATMYDAAAGSWDAATIIDDGSGNAAGSPNIRAGSNGPVMCAYEQDDGSGTNDAAFVNIFDTSTGSWNGATAVSGGADDVDDPVVVVDLFGNAIAAWELEEDNGGALIERVKASRYNASAGTWSAPITIDAGPVKTPIDVDEPNLAVDYTGNVFCVFEQEVYSGNDRIYVRRFW